MEGHQKFPGGGGGGQKPSVGGVWIFSETTQLYTCMCLLHATFLMHTARFMEKKWKQLTSSVIAMATINCCRVLKHVLKPALYGSLKQVEALIYM